MCTYWKHKELLLYLVKEYSSSSIDPIVPYTFTSKSNINNYIPIKFYHPRWEVRDKRFQSNFLHTYCQNSAKERLKKKISDTYWSACYMLKFPFAKGAAICDGSPVVNACIAEPGIWKFQYLCITLQFKGIFISIFGK